MTDHAGALSSGAQFRPGAAATTRRYQPASSRATAAQVMLGGAAALVILRALALTSGLSLGPYTSERQWLEWIDTVDGIGTIIVLWNLGTAVAFLAWLHRSVLNVPALGLGRTRWGPWASVGWWFVPIAFLLMPAVVVWDVVKRVRDGRDLELVIAWWLAFLGGAVISQWSGTILLRSLDDLHTWIMLGAGGMGVTAVAAVLALLIVRRTEEGSERAAMTRHLRASGDGSPPREGGIASPWRSAAPEPTAHIPNDLQVPFWSHPDAQRSTGGRDGRPPAWMSFEGRTAQQAVERLIEGELREHARRGSRVVEAAWADSDLPRVKAAFGDPVKSYDLLFPHKPRVVWESQVGKEADASPTVAPEEPPGTPPGSELAQSEPRTLSVTDQAESGPPADATRSIAPTPGAAAVPSTGAPIGADPTAAIGAMKSCPDCAEAILAGARICRFCRYEFWSRP